MCCEIDLLDGNQSGPWFGFWTEPEFQESAGICPQCGDYRLFDTVANRSYCRCNSPGGIRFFNTWGVMPPHMESHKGENDDCPF